MNVTGSIIKETEVSISSLEKNLKDETDPEEKAEWRSDIADEKETLKFLWNERIENWKNVFRKDGGETGYGTVLYDKFGNQYRMPTKTQIRDILTSLDAQHPGWDSGENYEKFGGAFIGTLQANFPDLRKQPSKSGTGRKKASASGGGCFSLVAAIVALFVICFLL